MSIFVDFLGFLWGTAIPFLVALTILVFVHEMGHYLVARRNGVRIEVFSIGFGPELKGWNDRHGTRWKISAVPLGGYVKMFGEYDAVSDETGEPRELTPDEKKVSFHHKRLMQRAAIVVAGPAVNYLFAILVFAGLFMTAGYPKAPEGDPPAVVGAVVPDGAAADAGLAAGDQIVAVGTEPIAVFSDLQRVVAANPGAALDFTILRDGSELHVTVIPRSVARADGAGPPIGQIGVVAGAEFERLNPAAALGRGIERAYGLTVSIFAYLGGIVSGEQPAKDLGGILRIAHFSGVTAQVGWASYISFLAVLSLNLGLINLFPIPLLDGGHLAFYVIEAVRGRPLGERAQEWGFHIGLALIIALFLFVTWNDIVYFATK